MKFYVYGLFDPRLPKCFRYVGLTTNLRTRMHHHRNNPSSIKLRAWIDELRQENIRPSVLVFKTLTDQEEGLKAEQQAIKQYRKHPLLNSRIGLLKANNKRPMGIIRTRDKIMIPIVLKTLEETKNNKLETAKRLGLGRQTIYNMLERWRTNKDQFQNLDT